MSAALDAHGTPGDETTAAAAADYAAARDGAGLVELPERALLSVSGATARKFVHALVSNDVLNCAEGQGCRAALMDVKGHLLALMRVLVARQGLILELPRERLDDVRAVLEHYRVAAPVRFAPRPERVLALVGPLAESVLARVRAPAPDQRPEAHASGVLAGHEARVTWAGDLPGAGFVLHVQPEAERATWDALVAAGARPIGRQALDALRIEYGRPWYGPDIDESNLLHETGLVRELHSPSKGCYVGQEVIARLEARGGHVNKALRALRLAAAVTPGTPVCAADQEVGRVTTAALSPRLGPLAMAYVHRNHFEPGSLLRVAGQPATVAALPLETPTARG